MAILKFTFLMYSLFEYLFYQIDFLPLPPTFHSKDFYDGTLIGLFQVQPTLKGCLY